MRKVKLQMQVSIDGFVAGEQGEMDWMTWNWDDRLKEYVNQLTESTDCILLGRVLAQGFIPHWSKVAADPGNPESEAGKKIVRAHKVVFTKTLEKSDWDNTVLAKGKLVDEINRLKNEEGGDIIVYGGGSFVSSLISENLIDEYHLFVNPVILGKGLPIFSEVGGNLKLELQDSFPFKCGITVNKFAKKGQGF